MQISVSLILYGKILLGQYAVLEEICKFHQDFWEKKVEMYHGLSMAVLNSNYLGELNRLFLELVDSNQQ